MESLRNEIAGKLKTLIDPQSNTRSIRRVYQAEKAYVGPYKDQAPDLIVGYERGYRVSWDAAIGRTTTEIFHTNMKAWSGDHCVDPSVVPGVLFCNHPIARRPTRGCWILPRPCSTCSASRPPNTWMARRSRSSVRWLRRRRHSRPQQPR